MTEPGFRFFLSILLIVQIASKHSPADEREHIEINKFKYERCGDTITHTHKIIHAYYTYKLFLFLCRIIILIVSVFFFIMYTTIYLKYDLYSRS